MSVGQISPYPEPQTVSNTEVPKFVKKFIMSDRVECFLKVQI